MSAPFSGNIVNFLAIVVGSGIGLLFGKRVRPEWTKNILQIIGLFTLVLGIFMAAGVFGANNWGNALVCLFSLVVGGIIGEILDIEFQLEKLSYWFGTSLFDNEEEVYPGRSKRFVYGLVSATLLFCANPLSILGAIKDIEADPGPLFAKSAIDGTTAVLFAGIFGIGILFSAIVVFVYQAIIGLTYAFIVPFLLEAFLIQVEPEQVTVIVSTVGGILLIGMGVNLLGVTKKEIPIANFLPALVISAVLVIILPTIIDFISLFITLP
ncbi:MAG: DUF554 domain-containing protein [Promethearchaeota archaeon]